MKNIKLLLKYGNKHIYLALISLALGFLQAGTKLYVPILFGKIIDLIFTTNDLSKITTLIIISSLLICISSLLNYLFNIFLSIYANKTVYSLRNKIYEKVTSVPLKVIDDKDHGEILSLLTNDSENVSNALNTSCASFIDGIAIIIFTIIYMFTINYLMALLVIVLTPGTVAVSYIFGKKSKEYFKEKTNNFGELTSFSFERINNYNLMTSYNQQENIIESFDKINQKTKYSDFHSTLLGAWINPTTRLINYSIYIAVVCCGSLLAFNPISGLIFTLGNLTSFLSYTNQYMKPFNEISNNIASIENGFASLNRINTFLSLENEKSEGTVELIAPIEKVELKDLCFSYDNKKLVTDHISFAFSKGEKIAIVGSTGCGKTTLINLLMKFYKPNSGEILFSNISSKEIMSSSIRKNIGMVLQDTWIFTGTILENIKYGNVDACFDDVIKASKEANADDFISRLPNGYDTLISSSSGLSQGERQLICIARMILANKDFVILDEATSNVDTRTEEKISEAFDNIMKNKTSIVIAHRLSTIKSANKILVMKDGKIIENGTHNELISKKGFYYALYMSQFE